MKPSSCSKPNSLLRINIVHKSENISQNATESWINRLVQGAFQRHALDSFHLRHSYICKPGGFINLGQPPSDLSCGGGCHLSALWPQVQEQSPPGFAALLPDAGRRAELIPSGSLPGSGPKAKLGDKPAFLPGQRMWEESLPLDVSAL